MKKEKVIIIGAGPCGLSTAIELKNIGIDPLIIEKGSVVDAIYNYPTHQMFLVRLIDWKLDKYRLYPKDKSRFEMKH